MRQRGPDSGTVRAVHTQPVGAGHLVARMHEPVGRRAVSCQEQEPGGHDVQPTNVREAGHLGEQPEHGAPPLRIGATDDVADRFVEREPSGARRAAYGTAVDRDLLGIGIDA